MPHAQFGGHSVSSEAAQGMTLRQFESQSVRTSQFDAHSHSLRGLQKCKINVNAKHSRRGMASTTIKS